MTQGDLSQFADIFSGLERMLVSRKLEPGEHDRMLSDYFKALRHFPIDAIRGGAEVVAQRAKHFPKPVEWIDAMPRADRSLNVPMMTSGESREYRAANASGWEADPCGCQACRSASVNHLPLRYVPDVNSDGSQCLVKDEAGRVVNVGHWAHGHELRRYYDAKAEFFQRGQSLGLSKVVSLIGRGGR